MVPNFSKSWHHDETVAAPRIATGRAAGNQRIPKSRGFALEVKNYGLASLPDIEIA
jgi:hypothetical protein